MIHILVAAALVCVGDAASCPDNMASFRSDFVAESFDDNLMMGEWYEQAFVDIAQVGTRCEMITGSFANTGELVLDFSVKYGNIPFTISEHYFDVSPPQRGHYTKKIVIPGTKKVSNLVNIDAVILDIIGNATHYEAYSLYGCVEEIGVVVPELQILSRSQNLDAEHRAQLIEGYRSRGIDHKKMVFVNRTSCETL